MCVTLVRVGTLEGLFGAGAGMLAPLEYAGRVGRAAWAVRGLVQVGSAPILSGILGSFPGIVGALPRRTPCRCRQRAARGPVDGRRAVYTDAKSAALCAPRHTGSRLHCPSRGVAYVCRHSDAVTAAVPAPDGATGAHARTQHPARIADGRQGHHVIRYRASAAFLVWSCIPQREWPATMFKVGWRFALPLPGCAGCPLLRADAHSGSADETSNN